VASLVVKTFPQAFLEVLHHSLQHIGRNCCQFFPDVLFQIHRCPWFLFVHLALEISSEEEVLQLGTHIPMNIEVPTKYPLSQDRIVVFEICLYSKSPMLYRPALHDNWNALSLARRAFKDKFSMPTVPLTAMLPNRQLFLPGPVYILFMLVYRSCIGILAFVWCAIWCTWTSLAVNAVNAYRLLLWHNFTSAVQINIKWVCKTDKCNNNNNGNKAWFLFRMCLLIQNVLKVA